MVRKLFGFVVLIGLWSAPASAQSADPPPLTLAAALDEALANNPTLAAARLDVETVRQRRAQEGFLAPPTLEAEVWQWPLTSLNPVDANMYMFTARQEIPGAGKRALRAAVVDKEIAQASNVIALQAREVLENVKQAYTRVFVGRQAVAAHQASVELLRQTADLMTARYGAGHGGQAEVLSSVAELSRLHNDLLMLEEQTALATVQLNTLLNRPAGAPVGELPAPIEAPLPPVADLQRIALERHPALTAARLDVERAQAALAVAEHDYKPDFMVGGGYQLMPRTAGAWTASVGLTWPSAPWSHGRLDAAKAQAAAEVAAAAAKQQVAVNAIAGEVQQAYVRAAAASARANLLKSDVIPQSEQVFEAARVAYQSDRGEASAVIADQRMVLDAQLDYFRALAELQQARADLEHAVGVDLEMVR